MEIYLSPFVKSFLLAVILEIILIAVSKRMSGKNRKEKRHIHGKNISRLGGAGIILAFLLTILFDVNLFISIQILGIIWVSLFILFIGLIDDYRELSWKQQLFLQICAVIFIFVLGIKMEFITDPFSGRLIVFNSFFLISVSFVISTIWILLMINSVNWLDGIDGLSGGVVLMGCLVIFLLSLKPEVNQPPIGVITMALAGSVFGFLIFNFYPAKIMAGTSGSFFMGFILAVLAIFAGTKIATTLMVMAVPIFDFFWVIGERMISGKSVFEPDQSHLHYKLSRLGWSPKKIAFLFYGVTLAIGIISLNTRVIGKLIVIFLTVVFLTVFFWIINQKIKEKEVKYADNE